MDKKPNPVKTTRIDDSTTKVTIDLTELKERATSNWFSFIIQSSTPETGTPPRVIYNVKGFLKAG